MKTIIAGTRTATRRNVFDAIKACSFTSEISIVVSGCNKVEGPNGITGADFYGEIWAKMNFKPVAEFPADWNTHGKAAGPIRNAEMADYADALILVWDGKSRGSRDMLQKAKAKGLRCFVWDYVKGCEVTG